MKIKLAELNVSKSKDWNNSIVKALEKEGFAIIKELETTTDNFYIIAKEEGEENDSN